MALGSQPRWTVRPAAGAQADIDVGLRQYMLRIYNYMASGLALTGIVAYVAAASGFYHSIAGTPLLWVVMLAPLGLVFWLSAGINRMSASTAQLLFWVYAGLSAFTFGFSYIRNGPAQPHTRDRLQKQDRNRGAGCHKSPHFPGHGTSGIPLCARSV